MSQNTDNKENMSLSAEEMYELGKFLSRLRASKYVLYGSAMRMPESVFEFRFVPVDSISGFILFAEGFVFGGTELSKDELIGLTQTNKIAGNNAFAFLEGDHVMLFNCGSIERIDLKEHLSKGEEEE